MPKGKYQRKRKQEFHFPSKEQEQFTDAELDAEIDGEASKQETKAVFFTESEIKKKKAAISASKDIPEIFLPEQVEFVFDLYVGLLCFIYSFIFKTDFKPLFEELKLEDDFKKKLSKPLARIASKYAPSDWAFMSAEIEVCMTLGVYTAMSFKRAEMVAKKEAERKQKEEMQKRQEQHRNTVMQPREVSAVSV